MQTNISESTGDYGKCTFNHTVENSLQKQHRHFTEDLNRKETCFCVTRVAPRNGIIGNCFLYFFFVLIV